MRPVAYPSPHDDLYAHRALALAGARRFRIRGVPFADRVQIAWLGMLGARKTWDPALGPWHSWAYKHIRYALLAVSQEAYRSGRFGSFAHMDFVSHRLATRRPEFRTEEAARAHFAGSVSDAYLAPRTLGPMLTFTDGRDESFEEPANSDDPEGPSLGDTLSDGDSVEEAEQRDLVRRWGALLDGLRQGLGALPSMILDERLWFDGPDGERSSLQEIGDRFGLSRERVRQVQERLRHRIREAGVKAGLLPGGRRSGR